MKTQRRGGQGSRLLPGPCHRPTPVLRLWLRWASRPSPPCGGQEKGEGQGRKGDSPRLSSTSELGSRGGCREAGEAAARPPALPLHFLDACPLLEPSSPA